MRRGRTVRARTARNVFGPQGDLFPSFRRGRASRAVTAATYSDLDTHPELVRANGHVEADGKIVLNRGYRPGAAIPGVLD